MKLLLVSLITCKLSPFFFSSSGYDVYDYDYGYGQGSGSNYGYGGKSWDSHRGNASHNSESIVTKINQRLDLLSRNDNDEQERYQNLGIAVYWSGD